MTQEAKNFYGEDAWNLVDEAHDGDLTVTITLHEYRLLVDHYATQKAIEMIREAEKAVLGKETDKKGNDNA